MNLNERMKEYHEIFYYDFDVEYHKKEIMAD